MEISASSTDIGCICGTCDISLVISSDVLLTKDEPDKRITPKAAANPIIATRTKILEFTRLTHFLDILNVEGDIDNARFVGYFTLQEIVDRRFVDLLKE